MLGIAVNEVQRSLNGMTYASKLIPYGADGTVVPYGDLLPYPHNQLVDNYSGGPGPYTRILNGPNLGDSTISAFDGGSFAFGIITGMLASSIFAGLLFLKRK